MTATAKEVLAETESHILGLGRVRASMRLDFTLDSCTGNTVLARSLQEPPLKVVRTFTLEDGTALAHLHNMSGGLLGGDHLGNKINLGCGARVQLTTTGATRIHRHRPDFSITTQANAVSVGQDALLEYLPDSTIPYAGSRYLQRTAIDLADGAGLFWWEIIAPGREARGELFAYEQFELQTSVRALGRKIAVDNLCIRPASHLVSALARLGPYHYAATFYICKVGAEGSLWRSLEDHLREVTCRLTVSGKTLWATSSLVSHGLVVRCLACHGRDVLPGLLALWSQAKLQLYGREAIPPRKIN